MAAERLFILDILGGRGRHTPATHPPLFYLLFGFNSIPRFFLPAWRDVVAWGTIHTKLLLLKWAYILGDTDTGNDSNDTIKGVGTIYEHLFALEETKYNLLLHSTLVCIHMILGRGGRFDSRPGLEPRVGSPEQKEEEIRRGPTGGATRKGDMRSSVL